MKISPKAKVSWRFVGRRSKTTTIAACLLALCLAHSGCLTTIDPPTYYGKVAVPKTQSFRWSDGGLPQTFDPAFAAAAPDTDVVRALFEGLTDYDPRTLEAVPAVATRWESSSDHRAWTFYLREDARWSNGERVTASDFVKSWQRTLRIGALAPHTELLGNIEGASVASDTAASSQAVRGFGAEAVNDHLLRVRLAVPDANFPALVAHPVFRPVKVTESNVTRRLEPQDLVSNGAFSLVGTEAGRVLLERAKTYWDGGSVALDQVEFVHTANSEDALAAYRDGRIDAVTSAPFEPLALKLLTPYKDFRRSTFGALTFYSFNISRAPLDDVRIREALAISIDRERVSRHDLGGATEAAGKFLPEAMTTGDKPVTTKTDLLEPDIARARDLFAAAGYPDGQGFPVIKLLINRNEQQRLVAQAIAAMWRNALNVETEIVMKPWDEYEAAMRSGDFDVVRRGIVMQTTDELTNLRMLFQTETQPPASPSPSPEGTKGRGDKTVAAKEASKLPPPVESEVQALKELKAMPIYFASSYALVKPYVSGFDANVLDAPSLKRTRIDTNWVERKP